MITETEIRQQRRFFGLIVGAVFANFILFIIGTLLLGGDAANVQSDQYFVYGLKFGEHAKRAHEVSRLAYLYSWLHSASVFLTWPIAIYALWRMNQLKKQLSTKAGG